MCAQNGAQHAEIAAYLRLQLANGLLRQFIGNVLAIMYSYEYYTVCKHLSCFIRSFRPVNLCLARARDRGCGLCFTRAPDYYPEKNETFLARFCTLVCSRYMNIPYTRHGSYDIVNINVYRDRPLILRLAKCIRVQSSGECISFITPAHKNTYTHDTRRFGHRIAAINRGPNENCNTLNECCPNGDATTAGDGLPRNSFVGVSREFERLCSCT